MIIERYIYQEITRYLLWLAGLLFLIFASNRFVEYLADAAAGKLPGDVIFNLLGYKLIGMLPTLLPVALFLAVLLAFSRLLRDSELTILAVAGKGLRFQLRTAGRYAMAFAVPLAAIALLIAPWAETKVQLLRVTARQQAEIAGIGAGQFKEFGEGERVVYVERVSADGRQMRDVFLQVRQHDNLGVLAAERARFETDPVSGSRYIVFEDGRRYLGNPGDLDYEITEYASYSVLIQRREAASAVLELEALPTSQLLQAWTPANLAELQWRASSVLAALLLTLLAVLLNNVASRQKPYLTVFIAMLLYFVYSNLLGVSKTLLKRGELPGWVGLWWVHALVVVLIVTLIYLPRLARWRRRDTRTQYLPAEN